MFRSPRSIGPSQPRSKRGAKVAPSFGTWEKTAKRITELLDAAPADPTNRAFVVTLLEDPNTIQDADLSAFVSWLFNEWGRAVDVGESPELLELATEFGSTAKQGGQR